MDVTAEKTVTVYVTPSNIACTATLRHMNSFGIQYATEDITRNASAQQEVEKLGYKEYPVTVAGDEHWAGFRPDLIREHLRPGAGILK